MLIICPECGLQVSDKASFCPHCGYPFKQTIRPYTRKSTKRKRLPNGFGQISEIKGQNLRKPFRAMVTVGKTSTGRPISRILKPDGYFETYNEAYQALVEYNRNPYEMPSDVTMNELFEKWKDYYRKKVNNEDTVRVTASAWDYCGSIYKMPVSTVRVRHLKGMFENAEAVRNGKTVKPTLYLRQRIKSLINLLFDYAIEYEITDKNYARMFSISNEETDEEREKRKAHIPFADWEMEKLWNSLNCQYVDCVLIQCYMGWRPQELCILEISNIDLENWTIKGGMKTEAGKNRVVPIHPRIRDLVKAKYQEAVALGSKYLINCTDTRATDRSGIVMTYDKYQHRFYKIREILNLNPAHRAHDCRVQFVTMCKKYNVDEYCIKYLVGHTISDITESIYTNREPEWFQQEISKIP